MGKTKGTGQVPEDTSQQIVAVSSIHRKLFTSINRKNTDILLIKLLIIN